MNSILHIAMEENKMRIKCKLLLSALFGHFSCEESPQAEIAKTAERKEESKKGDTKERNDD